MAAVCRSKLDESLCGFRLIVGSMAAQTVR
jgi:hypothetical protein